MGTVFPACILYGPIECPFKLRIGFTFEENINITGNFLTNVKPFKAIWFVSPYWKYYSDSSYCKELITKLSTHHVQIPAKTQVSFACYTKTSLLKTGNFYTDKSLLIKPNSRYQIICTFWNSCLAFILSVQATMLARIIQEHPSRGTARQPETHIYARLIPYF